MYKCENCRVEKESGDDVYLVSIPFESKFIVTCSKECAERVKQLEIYKLHYKMTKIENAKIIKEIW